MQVILVDDEKSMHLLMKKMLSKIPDVEVAAAFQSAGEAYKFLKEKHIDMAFVDISLPGENGLALAERIAAEFPSVDIVFLTSHREYALEAFDVQAIDYMVKPVSRDRLERTIRRVVQRRGSLPQDHKETLSAKLSVACLGGLEIRNAAGSDVRLYSSKSLELFAYLLVHKGKFVSKWNIIEDVFYGMPPQNAEVYMNTTFYKLRKALEPYEMKASVISCSEKYKLDISEIHADFLDFERRVAALNEITEVNAGEAAKVEKLYGGDLFQGFIYDWALPEKERLAELYRLLVRKLGSYLLEKNDMIEASRLIRQLALKNELDEEANCLLMRVYAASKDLVSLIRQYERYAKTMKRELGIPPSKLVTELYTSLRASFGG